MQEEVAKKSKIILLQTRKSTDKFLQKKGTYEEFVKYIAKNDIRSDKLHEAIKEKIKRREKEKYNEISKKNLKFISEGKFDEATNSLLALRMHLSPFNITDKNGNIGEAFLRIDKKIEEKVTKFKLQKNLYTQLFVKGNILETPNERIHIEGVKNGKVKYANIKGTSVNQLKDKDYKQVSWLMFLKKYKPGKFDLKKGGRDIDIKTDPKLAESKAHIEELKMLKQISFMYSGKLEKFAKTPAEKLLLKNALEENLGEMNLFFMKDSKGTVVPTQAYQTLPQSVKAKKLVGMMQGFQRIRMRMVLEEKEKKETNPNKVRFLKAEIDFQNGLHLSAYTKFKKYIKDNRNDTDEIVKKQVKHAKERLRRSSFYVINLAQRYSMACIQEPGGDKQKFHLSPGFKKKVIKKLTKVFSQLRKSMQSGKAADLDQAYAQLKDKPEGGLDIKMKEFGAKGITERKFLESHYSFVKTMITSVTAIADNDRQEEGLTVWGDIARKEKFRGGARVLYEEQMKRKLVARRRELMKDPKYRKKIRDRFMKLKLDSDRKTLSSVQVTKLLTKTLLDSNKTHVQSRSFLDDLKTLKQFEEKHVGLISKVKKGVTAAVGISSGHFNSIKRTLDALNIPANKKISKYEDFNPFAKTAGIYRRAAHEAGGLNKYMKLPLEKKKELFEAARIQILLAKHENIEHTINVHAYVKQEMAGDKEMNQRTNPVVYKYNDAYDPNNELFNLSDEGWDFVEGLVGEVPLMAASGGVGNVAALGVKQGAKYAVKKLAQKTLKRTILRSMTFKLGVRGTAFASDLAISEFVDRSMRYILRGETPPVDIAQLLAHSLGTYGSMKYASKGGQRLLRNVAEKGMVGKIASHAISTAVIEAPCMMAVNNLFGQAEGSMLEQYGRALGTMLASKGSMSMLHSSTGRVMLKAEQNYEIKDSINNIKSKNKRDVLNKMMNKGEIKVDQLGMLISGNLNYKQIKEIRKNINNPKSIKFLLAYKYAKLHGIKNKNLTLQYDKLIHQLMVEGFSKTDAEAYLKRVEKNTLTKAYNKPNQEKIEVGGESIKVVANKKYEGFKKIEVVEVDESNPRKPAKKIKIAKADGTSEVIDANTPLYTITGPGGKKITISASTAGHIDSLHIKNTEPGSNFNFKSFGEFVDALKKKLPDKVFTKDGKVVLSIDMGTNMGKEGISSMKELLKGKYISEGDVKNADLVRQEVYNLNATGDKGAKQAFVDNFRARYPNNKVQFQIVRGDVIVPTVNAPKHSTNNLFLVVGSDGKGGKTVYTAAPGRNMPRHPNPKQFTKDEGGVKGAEFKGSQRAWFDTVMLTDKTSQDLAVETIKRNVSKEAQSLINIIHKGDIVKALRDGKIQKLFPEIASMFGNEKFQHRTQEFTLGGHTTAALIHLRHSPEYAKLVKNNPQNKIILELATLLHDVAKKGGTKKQKLEGGIKPDPGHELKSAELASQILAKMNLPKDIQARVVRLVRNHAEVSDIAIVRTNLAGAKLRLQEAIKNKDQKQIQKIESEIKSLQKRAEKNEKKLSQMADELYDPTNLKMLQALNYADIKSVNDQYKQSLAKNKDVYDQVYKEVGELMGTVVSNARVENFTADNLEVINKHLQIVKNMSFKRKSVYITKLFKKNRVEALSVTEKLFYGTDVHNGTQFEAVLKNINKFKRNVGKVDECLSLIKGIRRLKSKDLQYGLMQTLLAKNPALYVAAMDKLTYELAPKKSAKNKLEKINKLRAEFTSREDLAALDKLAQKVRKEIAEKMLDTHATDIGGMTDIIVNGGLDTAHARKAKREVVKSTRGDDFKLAGSLSVFTYQGSFWEAKGKDVFMTVDSKFLNSKRANRSFYLTEDYVLKRPKTTDVRKDQLRKSFDEKLKDVMNRNDVKDYLAYRMAKHLMKEAKSKGVKTADIPYLDPSFNLVNYLNANSDTNNLPTDKLGGRPEGHLKFRVPIDKLNIRVPKATVKDLLAKAQGDLVKQQKYKDQGHNKYNPKDYAYLQNLVTQFGAVVKVDPKMTLKGFYIKSIKDAITHYEKLLAKNPDSIKLKTTIARLKNLKPDQIKEYEKGKLKGNQHKAKEYAEAVLGFEIPSSVQIDRYQEAHIFNRSDVYEVRLSKEYLSRFKEYLIEKRGISKSVISESGNRVVLKKGLIKVKDFNIKKEVYNFFEHTQQAKPVKIVEKKKIEIPNALKPLGRILKAKTSDVAEIYERLQKVKSNKRALDGIVNGVLKKKLGLNDEQISAILKTLE